MGIYFLLLVVGVCWGQYNPNTLSKRTSIVHLFEWRWVDIALECERYLAPNGFGGVQCITYCDIISGKKKGDYCTAVEIHVAADGMANFLIGSEDKDPFIVIHVDAKL